MPVTEEQYDDICDAIDTQDVYDLQDHIQAISLPFLTHEIDKLHKLAKKALDQEFDGQTENALEKFYDEVEALRMQVAEAAEALDKVYEFLSDAEDVLIKAVYADE